MIGFGFQIDRIELYEEEITFYVGGNIEGYIYVYADNSYIFEESEG